MLTPEEIRAYRKLFTALSDPTRLAIVNLLLNEPGLAVNDIVSRFTISQASISRHLQILQRAGLVDGRRDNKHVFYTVDNGSMAPSILIRFGALLQGVGPKELDALMRFNAAGTSEPNLDWTDFQE
jgi:DNA-binding transcriptional ArsR family regulator